ncbi:glycosyl transferase family protein [Calothrix sp. NIES-4071]|nr:glycosyl transferase family protein [Calothrix sp. NIES-4071]BAZ63460.1 glycosyl transferase family protein [Calothrix sp. NIES-4105]
MLLTVIVPTYRRPYDLARCLKALRSQTRSADEVVVVVRDVDTETWELLKFETELMRLKICKVTTPGQVNALNAGLQVATGDVIAITDDDAMPHPDWLERIEAWFASDSHIGGVGGRDWIYEGDKLVDGAEQVVGVIQWFGRMIGEHHLGIGEAREVEILKGANMSYRASALKNNGIGSNIRFDQRLRGTGAQVHNDLAFSLAVRSSGWKLIYDPKVAVNHYPAQRFDEDKRDAFNSIACINTTHNETLTLLEYLPFFRRLIYLAFAVLIGTQDAYGILQVVRFFKREKLITVQRFVASMQGRWQGFSTWLDSNSTKQASRSKTLSVGDIE